MYSKINGYICKQQKHVHEITGNTRITDDGGECHNHRFSAVTGEAVSHGSSHVHEIVFRTDFGNGHYHKFYGRSSEAVGVGGGKHVHFIKACTNMEDGHSHQFQAASQIDSPLYFKCR